jgi:hypothetical protein
VVIDPEKEEERSMRANEDASVSDEELNTGGHLFGMTLEDMLLSKYSYPGSLSSRRKGRKQGFTKLMAGEGTGKAKKATDPTLDFTTLLIAKPLPFKFELWPRGRKREQTVRELFAESVKNGDYQESRHYGGPNHGKDQTLGWGKV